MPPRADGAVRGRLRAMIDPIDLLTQMFLTAVDAAQPLAFLADALPRDRSRPIVVVGAGKAAASMAAAVEALWEGPVSGVVATRYGHAVPCRSIEVIEAAHPIPDANSMRAGERILAVLSGLGDGDQALCLLSGGGSSTMCAVPEGLTLADVQKINAALLASGANIADINCVRRHLSRVKGGRLAVACHPARLSTIAISDVPGDDLADIASGPTVADETTCGDALAVLQSHAITCPPQLKDMLVRATLESVKPGDPAFATSSAVCAMTPYLALQAAMTVARRAGVPILMLGDQIEGEAREVAKVFAGICRSVRDHGAPLPAPCILLSGGETTVTVRGTGRGGRNVEFLLALQAALSAHDRVYALAADTDGVDGACEVAGAFIHPQTAAKVNALGLSTAAHLADNDAHGFFEKLGQQVVTGPTRTNVNDFRAIYIAN